jgi:hypothetical protein
VEADKIDVFSAAVFRNLEQIQHAKESGCLSQCGSDIREADLFDGIDFNLPLIVDSVAAADLDVRPDPDPNAAGDFSAAHPLAQSFREDHVPSLRFSQIRHGICVKLFGSQEAIHTWS